MSSKKYTKYGIYFCAIFFEKMLDKKRGVWYNGRFVPRRSIAARPSLKSEFNKILHEKKADVKSAFYFWRSAL
jgi:hypothetical protein